MATINDLASISTPAEDSVVVVTDLSSSKKITISDLRNTMVRTASTTVAGAVKVGAGLSIDQSGVLNVTNYSGYTLPTATNTRLGGVRVGAGLAVDAQGVLSVANLTIPVASEYNRGTVQVGTGLIIQDGVLSNAVSEYVLPPATSTVLGGIKIGSGLVVTDSVVSTESKNFLIEDDLIIDENYTVPDGKTVYSVAPITIDRGVTFTVSANSTWVIYHPAIPVPNPEPPAPPVQVGGGTFLADYTTENGVPTYSISPVVIDRNVTVTIGQDSTWVIYSPGVAAQEPASETPAAITESSSIIEADYTIGENRIASSVGPITVDRAVTVTIPSLSTWVIF